MVAALATGAACADDPSLVAGPEPSHAPAMFRTVLEHLTEELRLPVGGDWPEDFGDGNYYGPGFFLRYGEAADNAAQIDLGEQTHELNIALVDEAIDAPVTLLQAPDMIMMSGMGLVEGYRHDPGPDARRRIEAFLDVLDVFGEPFDYYLESFEIIYGPTTINAALALLNLEFAYNVGGDGAPDRVARGLQILEAGRTIAYSEELGFYRFTLDNDDLYLYPNVMQMLAHVRAYQLTDDTQYLDRAIELYAAIQPLKLEGRYRSPYSAAVMGAQTDDYTTLSSQNYTMLALSQLYAVTGDDRYRTETIEILAFLESHLLQDSQVLHHWMDGEIAQPDDETYYCSGCNLQLLYIIWRLEDELL